MLTVAAVIASICAEEESMPTLTIREVEERNFERVFACGPPATGARWKPRATRSCVKRWRRRPWTKDLAVVFGSALPR